MTKKMITHEIGSLPKPEWRVKSGQGKKITAKDIADVKKWGKKLSIDTASLIDLLQKKPKTKSDKQEIRRM